ncbi:hypothetical protein GCM10010145_51820 [Streptomyces ruber]|uniref:DUF4190 domain-containing protein n=2 Tax=Streptomyces TaxID=1883 RepID=A0A918BN58_9ACTN|nr:DUF4190 domain-containing protein [Streptomyces ruber]GGQ75776.1 hypothetical protein GCM10010145_51820 [Streptomyces ruber]
MAWAHDQHGGGQTGPGTATGHRNGFGVAALVLGLLGAVLFWTVLGGIILGLLAVIFGILGYRRKKRGVATNGAMAIIGAVVGALALVVSAILLAAGVSLLNSEEFKSYSDCIRHADTQAEQEQCAKDFERDANN